MLKKKTIVAAKIETTVGTDITPAAADAVWNAYNGTLQPTIPTIDRERQGGFSRLPAAFGARQGTAKFSVDMTGGASDPLWGSLLPACGWVKSTGVYYPKSEPPGSNVKTVTVSMYEDGLLKKITGAAGTFVLNFMAGKPVRIDFTFIGCWVAPVDASNLTPTYETLVPPRFASSTLTIASYTPRISSLTIDAGNKIMMREDATKASGYISALITDRQVTGKLDPETSLVATQDSYGQWISYPVTEQTLAVVVGATNNQVTIGAPKLQFTNLQEGDRDKLLIDQLDFQCNGSSSLGDDELSITFA